MSSIFLNGKQPPYMEGSEYLALSHGQIQHAVMSMTYSGKERAAAVAILTLNKQGLSPAQIVSLIEE
ncbi:hypothetical protein [Treponema denticola]|uniref:hypothetical protein n=1 Tax=Treponema denticola TaxID=158 RepID=UPI0021079664|nr:hypothetical protein [Treponema denticola]UTY24256.1 hypothetical protein E4N78_09080 [Treponema denticola]